MKRLGYTRFVAQGGDVGGQITDAMAVEAPAELVGHPHQLPVRPPAGRGERDPGRRTGAVRSLRPGATRARQAAGLLRQERGLRDRDGDASADALRTRRFACRPRGLADRPRRRRRPAGGDGPRGDAHADQGTAPGAADAGRRARQHHPLLADEHRDLLRPAATGTTSRRTSRPKKFSIPAAFTVFPGEIYQPSRRWAERGYSNLSYFNEVDKGGHFAAWEQPQLFSEEVRAGFRSLRG